MRYLLMILLTIPLSTVGVAQEKYIFVFLNTNPNREELTKAKSDSLQAGHINNIMRLARENKLIVAGPFHTGGGIFIMNTDSIAEAKEWIQSDPAILAKRFKLELYPWSPRVNAVCKVDTTAEFVTYSFVKYSSHITKFNVQQAPQLFRMHDEYIEKIKATGNVVSEGVFDNSDGSILVMRGEIDKEVVLNDPAVQNGILTGDIKKIWVGKGSFCEN